MLCALLLCAAVASAPADTIHLVLVATTDVHGHATDWDYVADRPYPGGLARAATVVDSLRARYPGRVIVVDAGDLIEGEPFADYYARVAPRAPHPVVEAMNLIGYDVATPGNHEFDYGPAAFGRAVTSATFRYVSGNIRSLPGDTLEFPPYIVVTRGGVRVGIAGFTTPGVVVWSRKSVRGKVRVAPIAESAAGVLPAVRKESDVVVAVLHSGMDERSSYDTAGVGPENAAASLARLPVRPDLVVVGHTHRFMRDSVVEGIHFVQPKPYAQTLAVVHLDLVRTAGGFKLARIRGESVDLAGVAASPRVAARQASLKAEVREWAGQSLGESRGAMPAALARAEPAPIISFIQAVEKGHTGAELASATAFDLGAGFPDGDVRRRDLFALYPYENTLRAVRVSGAQLKAYLEQSARYYTTDSLGRAALDPGVPGYDYDMVSGASYDIDLRLPPGSRIRNLAVRGRPVAPTDSFTLAVNSYRQSGGGGFTMLRDAPVVYDRDENIRDLLAADIQARGHLDPGDYAENNWRIIPPEMADQVRRIFGGPARAAAPAAPADTILLRVLALGDFRGAVTPRAAALKAAADRAAAECRCPTVRVATGDVLEGTPAADLVAGRSVVEVLNRFGLDATALGARDFAWSIDTLRQRMAQSRFAWLGANVRDSATGRRPDWAVPYRMVPAGPLRVALVGYLSPSAAPLLQDAAGKGAAIAGGAAGLRDALAATQTERADFTVVLVDGGAGCRGDACPDDAAELARQLQDSKVDVLVAGGEGAASARVGRIPVVRARPSAAELAVVDLVRTVVGSREIRVRLDPVDPDRPAADSAIAGMATRAQAEADSLGRRVVARMKLPLGRSDEGESPLGNLVADAQRNALRADVGLVRTAAIGADLPAGAVTWWNLLALHEPPRSLATLAITGGVLRQALEQALAGGVPAAHVAGIVVEYDPAAPAGRRIRRIRFDDGRELKDAGSYRLAVAEPLPARPEYAMLASLPTTPSRLTDLDALVAYLRRLPQPVAPPEQVRFREVGR
jgi:2',3'-cyclic-nucleotide 2'-phosphodiesterase/3'-nucleotidase